jgi:hypothetical protein
MAKTINADNADPAEKAPLDNVQTNNTQPVFILNQAKT